MLYLYSKEQCPQCYQLEVLLKMRKKEFQVLKLDQDYTREQLEMKLNGTALRTFPVLFNDEELVGGLKESQLALMQGKV